MTFEQYIDEAFFQSDHYEKMKHQLLHVRGIMSREHKSFAKQNIKKQFSQCITIVCIAVQSQTDSVNRVRVLSRKKRGIYPYSVDHGFEPKKNIELNHESNFQFLEHKNTRNTPHHEVGGE